MMVLWKYWALHSLIGLQGSACQQTRYWELKPFQRAQATAQLAPRCLMMWRNNAEFARHCECFGIPAHLFLKLLHNYLAIKFVAANMGDGGRKYGFIQDMFLVVLAVSISRIYRLLSNKVAECIALLHWQDDFTEFAHGRRSRTRST